MNDEGFTLIEAFIVFIILAILASIAIFAVSSGDWSDGGNTDPLRGRVSIPSGYKYCDGPNLVYDFYDGGGSVVPDSPECAE